MSDIISGYTKPGYPPITPSGGQSDAADLYIRASKEAMMNIGPDGDFFLRRGKFLLGKSPFTEANF